VRSALCSSRRALRTLVVPALLLAACTTRPEAQQASADSSAGAASDSPARPAAAPPDSLLRPKPPLVPTPDVIRGLYVNRWAAVGQKMWQLIDVAKKTEINALVIDVKDDRGFVLYRSKVPLARQIGADTNTPMSAKRMRAVLDSMRVHGIYPIARIVVVKDPLLAQKKLEWAVRRRDDPGKPWLDKNGNPWLDPHHDGVWRYAVDLAKEAVDLGFSEVQLDYVRFPDEKRLHREATFPLAKGRSRAQVIRDQLGMTRELLEPTGVPMTIDVFGLTTSDSTDMGIGQRWEAFIDRADAVLPMTYPSHYARGNYGLANPNASPYATIDRALEDAKRRTHPFADSAATIIPWYQDFTLGAPRYGATQVRAQMQAGYDNGFPSWILWNPRSVYTISALKPDGEERKAVEAWKPSRDSVPPPPAPADSARRDSIPLAPPADSVARTPPDSAPAPPRR
jgi:hypothetical protein